MAAQEQSTDEELMRAYQDGDLSAFERLYRRYSGRLYGYFVGRLSDREVAGDLFQGAFLKLHEGRHRYDPSYPFAPWLFTIARNLLTDHFRKTGKEPTVELVPESITASAEPARELPAWKVLTEPQRQAIRLRYGEDLRFDEIARKLETTPSNVRQLVSRGIRKLRGAK
ncbi:MAG: sigma-70 family RNA polymerase sigma factor [Pseudomonadota bacterium]